MAAGSSPEPLTVKVSEQDRTGFADVLAHRPAGLRGLAGMQCRGDGLVLGDVHVRQCRPVVRERSPYRVAREKILQVLNGFGETPVARGMVDTGVEGGVPAAHRGVELRVAELLHRVDR